MKTREAKRDPDAGECPRCAETPGERCPECLREKYGWGPGELVPVDDDGDPKEGSDDGEEEEDG